MSKAQPSFAPRHVLIVEDDTLVGMGLRSQLEKLGHQVVGQAATAAEAQALFRGAKPDVVLLDIRLDGADGIELARTLSAERRCPMLIVTAFSDRELIERAGLAGVFGYLIKPVSAESLSAQLEIAIQRFEEHEQAIAQRDQATRALEDRKLIERAKGIFMRRLKLDEPEAHRRLQQESQKRRIALADLARKIIESEELLGGEPPKS